MVTIELAYEGDLRVTTVHGPSRQTLSTDAPVDNQGKGESYSPTDLLATALGSCMLTVMGIAARSRDIPLEGTTATVDKHMSQDEPRRISILDVRIDIPYALLDKSKVVLKRAAETCPVAQSINPAIKINFEMNSL
ncbi:MAG: OsmC family protein [Gammaproteobacteria bacterium]|jgi:putative redox protein